LWNLFLLLIPFFLCYCLIKFWQARLDRKSYPTGQATKFRKIPDKLLAFILGILWLLFIPNSAYIMTEVRHLLDFCPINSTRVCIDNAWMIMFFFTYAIVGWIFYVYLLNQMKFLVNIIWRQLGVKIYIITIIPFISLGVMLGLINRWNSWEVFITPYQLINDIAKYFTNFIYFKNWLLFIIFLYLLYFGGNYLFKKKSTK